MTSTAWQSVNERSAAIRTLLALLADGRPLPRDLAPFDSTEDRVRALHELWSRRLLCRIDTALELDGGILDRRVVESWRRTEADLPGVRRLLDDHAHEPWLARLDDRVLRSMALAAGRVGFGDRLDVAAAAGRRLLAGPRLAVA